MSLSAHLESIGRPLLDEQLAHPTVRGIAAGTLPDDDLPSWLEQDFLFLLDYVRVFSRLAWQAPDGHLGDLVDLAHETLHGELELHRVAGRAVRRRPRRGGEGAGVRRLHLLPARRRRRLRGRPGRPLPLHVGVLDARAAAAAGSGRAPVPALGGDLRRSRLRRAGARIGEMLDEAAPDPAAAEAAFRDGHGATSWPSGTCRSASEDRTTHPFVAAAADGTLPGGGVRPVARRGPPLRRRLPPVPRPPGGAGAGRAGPGPAGRRPRAAPGRARPVPGRGGRARAGPRPPSPRRPRSATRRSSSPPSPTAGGRRSRSSTAPRRPTSTRGGGARAAPRRRRRTGRSSTTGRRPRSAPGWDDLGRWWSSRARPRPPSTGSSASSCASGTPCTGQRRW